MPKEYYKYLFIVLTYKNSSDLIDFISSVKNCVEESNKILIVNSYYDEDTKDEIERIATLNDCPFINVENRGYGAGNNRGIEYAKDNFEFDFLIVSNPDITIKEFKANCLDRYLDRPYIIAPEIICRTNKKQNPATVKNFKFATWLMYRGYKKRRKIVLYCGIALNKVCKLFCKIFSRKHLPVFQAHGSFVVFNKQALDDLDAVYDENIFMFCEELDLAHKAKVKEIKTVYSPDVYVYHKEDGSIKVSDINVFERERESFIYCYEKWKRKNNGR